MSDFRHFASRKELLEYRDRVWAEHTYECGDFKFLWITGEAEFRGKKARLTQGEADVLIALIKAWPIPIRGADMKKHLTTPTCQGPDDAKVMVRRIRKKLELPIIYTSPRGYIFDPEVLL